MKTAEYVWVTSLAASTAVVVLILLSGSIPPMDDTYIHMEYGRSLFSGEPLCFNPGEPSSGFTSPLWLIPSAFASLAGSSSAAPALMLFSTMAAVTAMLFSSSRKASLLLISGPFLFHAGSGMETGLACLFVALVWRSFEEQKLKQWKPLILAGAFLCRPELAVLGLPMLIPEARCGIRRLMRFLLPVTIAAVLWIIWNMHATGLPLPGTFYAKHSLSWIEMVRTGMPSLLKNMLITSPLLLIAAVKAVTDMIRRKSTGWQIPVLLGAAALITQPNSYFQMRYWVPFLFACGLATGDWLNTLGKLKKPIAILLVLSLIPGLIVFADRRIAASEDVAIIDRDPALYLASIALPRDTVAAADIGAVGWYTDLYVLDLDGLINPERLPDELAGPEEEWRKIQSKTDYLLAFPEQYSPLIKAAGNTIREIATYTSPRSVICGEKSVTLWEIITDI